MDLVVQIGSIVLGVVILVFLVVVHELGHAIAARRSGVVVEEFGIGFPPAAWSRKLKNGVLFSVNWLPLGGFVKLQGEHDAATKPGDYGAASLWQKTRILLAGVAINWLTAAVLLTIVALMGMPKILPNQFVFGADTVTSTSPVLVASTVKDSPAQKAGLQKDDVLLSFAGQKMTDAYQLSQLTAANKGEKVDAVYTRKGVKNTVSIQLNASNAGGKGYLGAAAYQTQPTTYRSTWSAPIVGVGLAGQLSWETIKGLGTTVAQLGGGIASQISGDKAVRAEGSAELDKVSQGVAGPLGILGVIFPQAVQAGVQPLLLLTAIISLTLAVMNILPIPALDGGRWFVTVLFRLMRKPLGKQLEEKIHGTGFMILMGLVVLVTVADVGKLFAR